MAETMTLKQFAKDLNSLVDSNENVGFYPYSKLIVSNDEMSEADISKIIKDYENGVKYTIFTNNKDNILKLNIELENLQKKNNISIKSNKVIVGFNQSNFNNSSINLFNF